MGKTKQPSYRLVVADSRSPRDGRFIEIIGHYNPVQKPKVLHIKRDRARYWLGVGAQPSETVVYLFKKTHILDDAGQVIPESEFSETGEPLEEPQPSDPAPVSPDPAPAEAAPAEPASPPLPDESNEDAEEDAEKDAKEGTEAETEEQPEETRES
jgi:small subunit ribosomal protein S16